MRRAPNIHDVRAALWTWRAVRSARAQLRAGAFREVVVPAPPALPERAGRAVRRVLAREQPSCLERSLVLQRWLLAHGRPLDVVIGTRGGAGEDFAAHAWLENEQQHAYVEMTRLAP
jgi:hypothetical protein